MFANNIETDFSHTVPPETPRILVQQRVNSYHISLRGPEDDSFGAPKLDDHYSNNQPYITNNEEDTDGWNMQYKDTSK